MTWEDFDEAIDYLSRKIKSCHLKFKAIYGVPRGGWVVAVAMSHRLNIPVTTNPLSDNLLVVDDISDSGATLTSYTSSRNTLTLFSKYRTKMVPDFVWKWMPDDVWIIFPWEVNKNDTKI
jgi:hypoxanthine phosphoribosyltransferase